MVRFVFNLTNVNLQMEMDSALKAREPTYAGIRSPVNARKTRPRDRLQGSLAYLWRTQKAKSNITKTFCVVPSWCTPRFFARANAFVASGVPPRVNFTKTQIWDQENCSLSFPGKSQISGYVSGQCWRFWRVTEQNERKWIQANAAHRRWFTFHGVREFPNFRKSWLHGIFLDDSCCSYRAKVSDKLEIGSWILKRTGLGQVPMLSKKGMVVTCLDTKPRWEESEFGPWIWPWAF